MFTPEESRAFSSWCWMMKRCFSCEMNSFLLYSGRGITVCDRWLDWRQFLADMGGRPPGLSLGRIDNEGPYSPENCRWEDDFQQAQNTRRTVRINGVPQSVVAREIGMSAATVMRRLINGRDVRESRYFKRNKLTRDDVACIKARMHGRTNVDVAKEFSISHTMVSNIRRGLAWADVPAARDHLVQMEHPDQLVWE